MAGRKRVAVATSAISLYGAEKKDNVLIIRMRSGGLQRPAPAVPIDYKIGVEWDRSSDSPALKRIDINNNEVTSLSFGSFDEHPIWGNMGRCLLSPAGVVVYGDNARGDGLDLTGGLGRVMVEIPKFYVKSEHPSDDIYRYWISSSPYDGFELHPAFVQRGGTEKDYIYAGAYEASIEDDGQSIKLHSKSGEQPFTGGTIWTLGFDGGQNEPNVGDEISGGTEGGAYIVDWRLTGGSWAGDDATGILYLKKPGDDSLTYADNDDLTNDTQSNTLAGGAGLGATGAASALSLDIGEARTYAENIGSTRWGLMNIWSSSAIQLLYFIEYANFNSQSTSVGIGGGVTDKASGTGFAGELCGADNANTNIGTNGTGTGTGDDTKTPIVYRGIENLWGNTYQFIDGYNAVDAEYRLINRDGSGTFADTLAGGDYEASDATPITGAGVGDYLSGYISDIEYEALLKYLLIAKAVTGGSASTYLCDYFYSHKKGDTNILRFGGRWTHAALAGVASLNSEGVASYSVRNIGGRLEFI